MWQDWVNGVVGLWLIGASLLNLSASAMQMNLLIGGIVIAVLAFWGAMAGQQHHSAA